LYRPLFSVGYECKKGGEIGLPKCVHFHETLLVNSILTPENRSPFSVRYYKMCHFV